MSRRRFLGATALSVTAPLSACAGTDNSSDSEARMHEKESEQCSSSLLFSDALAPAIPETEDLYGWLIGGWSLRVIDHLADGTRRESNGECHFARALEGRAVQDVWIIPRVASRQIDRPATGDRYGTTLRVYDARRKAWRITWINPVNGSHNTLFGRREAGRIVQEGVQEDGSWMRWTFDDITDQSFRWLGEQSRDAGKTWQLGVEMLAQRTSRQALR